MDQLEGSPELEGLIQSEIPQAEPSHWVFAAGKEQELKLGKGADKS